MKFATFISNIQLNQLENPLIFYLDTFLNAQFCIQSAIGTLIVESAKYTKVTKNKPTN